MARSAIAGSPARWFYGIEGQGNWADFNGTQLSPARSPATTNRTRVDAFGLFTGQIGYAWNNALLYVKGGGAVVGHSATTSSPRRRVQRDRLRSRDTHRRRVAVGAGLEFGFTPNWSVGVEYNHIFSVIVTSD